MSHITITSLFLHDPPTPQAEAMADRYIAEQTAKIRATWSQEERVYRQTGLGSLEQRRSVGWLPPEIAESEIGLGQ